MSKYTIIDSVDFSIKNMYDLIDSYFESPIVEKIKDDPPVSIYMCKISTLLASIEQRYLVIVAGYDKHPIGKKMYMSNINWKSFQTRTLAGMKHEMVKHSYSPKQDQKFLSNVTMFKKDEDHTEYKIEGNNRFIISLLHKNKNLFEYPPSGRLAECLETFQTVILLQ